MLPGRASAVASARERLAEGRSLVITGPPGVGRSAVLQAVGDGFEGARRASGFALLRDEQALPLAMALRAPTPETATDATALASWVVAGIGPAVLLLDDAHLVDSTTATVLPLLVGRIPLACTVSTSARSPLVENLTAAGAMLLELAPLGVEAARRVVGDIPEERWADAGGNPRLLVDLRDGALSARSQRMVQGWADGLDAAGRRAAALWALAGGALPAPAETSLALSPGDHVPRLVGHAVLGALPPEETRDLHAELGAALVAAGDPVRGARHLAASGRPGDAREVAIRAAAAAPDGRERAAALDVAGACSPDGDPLLLDAAAALLAVGRPAASHLERAATDDRLPALTAREQRQAGDGAAATRSLVSTGTADGPVRRELALLGLWPGWGPEAAAGAPGAAAAVAPWPRPVGDVLRALAELDPLDPEDELHRLVIVVVLGLLSGTGVDEAVAALTRFAGASDGSRWHRAGTVADALVRFHRVAAEEDLVELATAAGAAGFLAGHGLLALADLGRTSEALRLIGPVEGLPAGERAVGHWIIAEVNLVAGRVAVGRDHARRALEAVGHDHPVHGLAAVTAAWAAAEAGEPPDTVRRATGVLGVDRATAVELSAIHVRGAGAPGASAAFAEAAEAWRALSVRSWLRCRWAAGDVAGAVDDLEAVEREARQRGMLPLAARARQSLRRLGVRTRAARLAGDGGLSGREREVLSFVADGVPSREIAQRLGVSRSTVETQIASAMGKLGARTRLHAVALLAERDAS